MGKTAPASPTRQHPEPSDHAASPARAHAPPNREQGRDAAAGEKPNIPPSDPEHDLDAIWERVLAQASESNAWAGLIGKFRLRSIAKGVAHVEVLDHSLRSHARNARSRKELGDFLSSAAGQTLGLSVTVGESDGAGAGQASQGAAVDPKLRAKAEQDPLVRRAMELFNARITDVRQGRGDDESTQG